MKTLQQEIEENMKKFEEIKAKNTIKDDSFPKLKKTFTYRKHIDIGAFEAIR